MMNQTNVSNVSTDSILDSLDLGADIPAISDSIPRALDIVQRPVSAPSFALVRSAPSSFVDLLPTTGHAWTASKVPLFTHDSQPVDGAYAVRRDTDRRILGVVGSTYEITHPIDLARTLDSFFQGLPIALDGALTARHGSDLVLMARLPEEFNLSLFGGKDVTEAKVLFRTSFDGKSATAGHLFGKRLVCSNGLRVDSIVPGSAWKVRHTAKAEARREQAIADLRGWAVQWKGFMGTAQALAAKQLTSAKIHDIVQRVVLEADYVEMAAKKVTKQQARKIETIEGLVEGGLGTKIAGVRGTAWGVMQAVSEFQNHYGPAHGDTHAQAQKRAERVLEKDDLTARAVALLLKA
jgi:phage/plasmid-like protein (TIGR03299 family)